MLMRTIDIFPPWTEYLRGVILDELRMDKGHGILCCLKAHDAATFSDGMLKGEVTGDASFLFEPAFVHDANCES